MAKSSVVCPACGSTDVIRAEKQSSATLMLGQEFFFNEISYKCNVCETEADFFNETEKYYLKAEKEAQANLVQNILEELNKKGISMASFERVFELPVRTLTRWKNGDFSSSVLALLRIVKTYPWIIEVAENRFESTSAKCVVIKVALQEFQQQAEIKNTKVIEAKNVLLTSSSSIFDISSKQTNKTEPTMAYHIAGG